MTIKRILLTLMTIAIAWQIIFSLSNSLEKTQIQSNLELYQTNLILHATELKPDKLNISPESSNSLQEALNSLIGGEGYDSSRKQYETAIVATQKNLDRLQIQLDRLRSPENIEVGNDFQQQEINKAIASSRDYLEELKIKSGIIETAADKTDSAIQTWQEIVKDRRKSKQDNIAFLLQNIWQEPRSIAENAETIIQDNLTGWFRYHSLKKLYQIQERSTAISTLEASEQNIALQSLIQLVSIGAIPIIGAIIGVILAIFLVIQLAIKKEQSILATNANITWSTPWDWEITWQVIAVGFFFVSQFILPILFGSLGLNPASFTVRQQAIYILVSYLAMAASGLGILYLSIRKYFPLPQEWFKFNFFSNWFLWGFGGYLVALPLVVIVSLINQQIWQGQGGSNPLLSLALKSQDSIALAIFFFTASVAAPIFEEIIFRGFLLPSLSKYLSVTTAIILSSFLFAIAHLSLAELVPLMTLGIILGVVYSRSRNLLSSILLHSLWNGGTLISLFILGAGQ